jgi:hypothetical protein
MGRVDPWCKEADIGMFWMKEMWICQHDVEQVNIASAVTGKRNVGNVEMLQKTRNHFCEYKL